MIRDVFCCVVLRARKRFDGSFEMRIRSEFERFFQPHTRQKTVQKSCAQPFFKKTNPEILKKKNIVDVATSASNVNRKHSIVAVIIGFLLRFDEAHGFFSPELHVLSILKQRLDGLNPPVAFFFVLAFQVDCSILHRFA